MVARRVPDVLATPFGTVPPRMFETVGRYGLPAIRPDGTVRRTTHSRGRLQGSQLSCQPGRRSGVLTEVSAGVSAGDCHAIHHETHCSAGPRGAGRPGADGLLVDGGRRHNRHQRRQHFGEQPINGPVARREQSVHPGAKRLTSFRHGSPVTGLARSFRPPWPAALDPHEGRHRLGPRSRQLTIQASRLIGRQLAYCAGRFKVHVAKFVQRPGANADGMRQSGQPRLNGCR